MKVVTALLEYDYGIKERGVSLEKKCFFPAIQKAATRVAPLWLEENGFPSDLVSLQKNVIRFAELERPDLLFFILMRDEITPETIRGLSERFTTVNWFCDDQWRFDDYTRIMAPLFTIPVTTDKYSLQKYRRIGCDNVMHSQWAAVEYLEEIDFGAGRYEYDISFIGGKSATRKWMVDQVEKRGFRIACFGSGWDNGRIDYEKMKEIISTSRINLNMSNSMSYDFRFLDYLLDNRQKERLRTRKGRLLKALGIGGIRGIRGRSTNRIYDLLKESSKNVEQLKARNFEIPAYGGFELTQYCLELEDYFEIGKELAVFSTVDELLRQIEYYLGHDEEREEIRRSGHRRAREHTYEKRMKKLFGQIKTMREKTKR